MTAAREQAKFVGLWRRALALPSLGDLREDLVADWAREAGLTIQKIEERDVGSFRPIRALVVTTSNGAACLPKVPAKDNPTWLEARNKREHVASLWRKVEWFSPLWVPRGQVNALLKDVEHRSKEEAISLFDYHTSTIYILSFQAVCIAQLMPNSRSLADFAPIAREAYLAFYAGYRASSIAALIPVVEGVLRRISGNQSDLPIPSQIDHVIDQACILAGRLHYDHMWLPREYLSVDYLYVQDERVFVFETFRRWLKETFFRRTGEYDGITWLNRHLFAHGTSTEWQNAANFSRLVVVLATLGVIESWHDESNRVSLFFPDMNDDSKLLWQQALNQGHAQMAVKLLEQKQYQEHGRLVPLMPIDNGVTLRKAHLKQECIKDLVRPLRQAGWSVDVGEPDDQALFMQIVASSGEDRLRVALLFSCGTDNKLYKELEQDSDAILYLGAPYHQDQYAYGISMHVGPVTGWQPPRAPHRA